jgi:hypothetical protein
MDYDLEARVNELLLTLKSILADIKENFPDLVDDETSLQSEWVRDIEAVIATHDKDDEDDED